MNLENKKVRAVCIIFQKKVVSLWRAFALHWYKHCWKEKTLEVYWVSETSKIQNPEDRQLVFVQARTSVAVGVRLLEVPRYHGDGSRTFLFEQ